MYISNQYIQSSINIKTKFVEIIEKKYVVSFQIMFEFVIYHV